MGKHALLSASSSHRWLNCPPSARLGENYTDKSSDFAAEGTDAHTLCEFRLSEALGLESDNPTPNLTWYNEEMETCSNDYVSYITELLADAKKICTDPVVLIEQRLDYSRYVESGFGTGDCGFVGGHLKGGIRKNGNVICRSIGALDADYIDDGSAFIDAVKSALSNTEYFIYSTHSHTPESPRYRLVILFSRGVSEDEYPALMRMIAKQISMDYFDDSTYQANRMMFWASCPSNGDFVFEEEHGEPLDPDKYLSMYVDWHDVTQWPTSSRQSEIMNAWWSALPMQKAAFYEISQVTAASGQCV